MSLGSGTEGDTAIFYCSVSPLLSKATAVCRGIQMLIEKRERKTQHQERDTDVLCDTFLCSKELRFIFSCFLCTAFLCVKLNEAPFLSGHPGGLLVWKHRVEFQLPPGPRSAPLSSRLTTAHTRRYNSLPDTQYNSFDEEYIFSFFSSFSVSFHQLLPRFIDKPSTNYKQ